MGTTLGNLVLITVLSTSISAFAKPAAKPARKSVSLKLVLISETPAEPGKTAPAAKPAPVKEELETKADETPAAPAKRILKTRVRKPSAIAVRPEPPVKFSPKTGSYEKSTINFNGLINKADVRQSKLEKRVKAKTARKEKKESKLAQYGFDDVEMKWAPPQSTEPKAHTVDSQPRAPQSAEPFSLELRPKNP